jgi:hypothetical protein
MNAQNSEDTPLRLLIRRLSNETCLRLRQNANNATCRGEGWSMDRWCYSCLAREIQEGIAAFPKRGRG